MSITRRPIVITCGDPAGVGPEVAVSAWKALKDEIPLCLVIDPDFLPKDLDIKILDRPPSISDIEKNILTVIEHNFAENRDPGKPNPKNAEATITAVERGVNFIKNRQCSAICTMPISKSILKEGANFYFPGHTEYLAHLDGRNSYGMMLVNKYLRVVPKPGTNALTIVPFLKEKELSIGSIKTISPCAIQASIIESPFTVRAKTFFFFKTSDMSKLSCTSL